MSSHPTIPASVTTQDSPLPAAQPTLRARLDSATLAILQTRDQVSKALDKHLQELHALRRAMGEGDSSLMSLLHKGPRIAATPAAPTPAAPAAADAPPSSLATIFHERAPMAQAAPQAAAPNPAGNLPQASAPPAGLETTTLEELNAALALAFAQVSATPRIAQLPTPMRR